MGKRRSIAGYIFLLCGSALIGGCSQGSSVVMAEKPIVVAPSVEYIGQWGVKGDGPGQLKDPSGIATNSLGDIFIADAGSAFISKFAPEGKPLLSFQEDGLNHPQSIAIDSGGAIYVTDPVRDSVFIFLPNGDRYRELRLRTRPAVGNALSVAVGDDGLIHVLDSNAGKVFTYTPRLRLVQTWQPRETFPGSKRFGPLVKGPDDYLYLATPSGGIMKLTREGHLISEIVPTTKDASWNPNGGFAVWSNCLFFMDSNGLMLHIVGTDGGPKLEVDLAPQLGQAARAAPPLAVNSHGELLVLDAPETRVLRYRVSF
jgi:hypothetical protein